MLMIILENVSLAMIVAINAMEALIVKTENVLSAQTPRNVWMKKNLSVMLMDSVLVVISMKISALKNFLFAACQMANVYLAVMMRGGHALTPQRDKSAKMKFACLNVKIRPMPAQTECQFVTQDFKNVKYAKIMMNVKQNKERPSAILLQECV
mgnify:CR=1 FL=1